MTAMTLLQNGYTYKSVLQFILSGILMIWSVATFRRVWVYYEKTLFIEEYFTQFQNISKDTKFIAAWDMLIYHHVSFESRRKMYNALGLLFCLFIEGLACLIKSLI